MGVLRRCALSLSLVLVFAPGLLPGAEVPGEAAAFNPAKNQLRDGFAQLAEAGFAEFALKFTNSMRLAEAFLYQAQARYQMTNYAGAIDLLLAHQGQAGEWGDQYLFWLGQASLQKGDYPAAVSAFSNLVSRFPNSSRCLEAGIGEATAWAKRSQWPRVIELLQKPGGVFQSVARTNSANDQVQSGYLLLAEAFFTRQDYASADSVLQPWGKVQRNPKLDWQWQDLLCRIRLAQARPQDALQYTTNLLAAAAATTDRRLLAESFVFRARLLEQLDRPDEALCAYTNNLVAGVPPERQREALDKITGLLVASNRIAEAVQRLEEFSDRVTNAPPADFALLMAGELRLRLHVTGPETNRAAVLPPNALPASTNLQRAVQALRDLEKWFPQSPLAGQGQLDLAWCLWQQQDWAGCQAACTNAIERLPVGLDQATARFKLADAQFEQKNFPGATSNYNAIVERYRGLPEVETNLFEPALYQAVRAALEAGDLAKATNALAKILARFPDGFHAERASLLAGQAMSGSGNPAGARDILTAAAQRVPAGPLLPRLRLAIARSFELENKLPKAIEVLTNVLEQFPNCDALPQAQYCLALDCSLDGNQTNALMLFTNFVTRFPTNEFTPLALWWLGSYYFKNPTWLDAERYFKLILDDTNLPPWAWELKYQARMMAGRAALATQANWPDAITHFTSLINDTNCPSDLRFQAMFAYGDTLISQESTNRIEDYAIAIKVFRSICRDYPTNRQVFLAYGQEANCQLQWAALTHQPEGLTNALAAYQQVIASTNADASARSMAQVGQGAVLEKLAEPPRTGAERKALLEAALSKYLGVFYGTNLFQGERADPFWIQRAALDAARLVRTPELQNHRQEINLLERLKKRIPVLGPSLDSSIIKAGK